MGSHNAKRIKQRLKDHPEVLPYNDLNYVVDVNFDKLVDIANINEEQEKKKYYDNTNLDTEKNFVPIHEGKFKFKIN